MTEAPGGPHRAQGDGGRDLPSYLDLPLRGFLSELAAAGPAPAAGSAAALAVTLGASLCEMAAGLSARQLGERTAAELAAAARETGRRCAELIQADAAAYAAVIGARRAARAGDPGGQQAVADALAAATAIPMEIIEAAAQVVPLAERLAVGGNPSLRGDAVTAALLAEAAARAAAVLVRANQAGRPAGDRQGRTAALLAEISRCRARLRVPR